ncbi:D-aspartate oxidase [Amyelois transitella]|uniref:D-aspartate oxidase n=1 Tax=Amyelois transitella TaxID=680683 RepID=UPI0029906CB1|nr:D-aspartate oxidase [Amyelois transitella]XP_060802026.1 D-aspartate oxidase [Amyelois transitella]XP_060802027.1 D-aspartate oxidase [Amyelois transitella]
MDNAPRIGVIGAGVVGLTVADILQKNTKAKITVIAETFREDTVSSVAAGIFRPASTFKGPSKEITKKWIHDSWHYWQDILRTPESPKAGIFSFNCYVYSTKSYEATRNRLIEDLVPYYKQMSDDELNIVGGQQKYGSFFSTVKIGCDSYLPWTEKRLKNNGVKIIQEKVESFASIAKKFDLVFNCTGLGARYLCGDEDVIPIRGQIAKVKAPWLKAAFYGDFADTYIIPGIDGLATLGGVRGYDSYNTEFNKHEAAAIFERCYNLLPPLRKAEVLGHRVGLRPHRAVVRVEPELVGDLRVVHCYGHGGYGVTTAPGTALYAVNIGLDLLKTNSKL